MGHLVGGDKDAQYRSQRRQVMQVLGEPLSAHHLAEDPAPGCAKCATAQNHSGEGHQALTQAIAGSTGDDEAVHHYR
ncbi:hypothetical protein D3C72_1695300 [compost metagenome]